MMMTIFLAAVLMAADPVLAKTPPEGVLPVGADGKPLNLDFETGTLKDWTADGKAFEGQPIKGDTVFPRRSDNKSQHQGQYWIGGFEKLGDKAIGTLTSVPFAVTHPWGSFLVAGGTTADTCVEVVLLPGNEVIFRASGVEEENLRRVAVDLTKYKGKQICVRVIDKHVGHWGHVNFDDFRFHSEKPEVPKAQGPPSLGLKIDDYKYAGLPPEEAAKAMTVPPGFKVTLFAGEPDVHQPIASCFDDRGRLWVVEAYTYPQRNPHPGPVIADKKLGDKILIFEDTDGDGKFDKKTVFFEGLNLVSGIEYGFGGVWVGAAPYLLFIPIDKTGDKPAGEPKILLDGWGYQDTHETLNSFIWGPDGWLYGCHGVFTHSKVGKPGTPDAERTPINAGIWRYHPTKHTFEVFAHGTSNPWGLDYNKNGDFFIEACVIPHMWHMIQGGRYERQGGTHFNPYTYGDIKTIALHRHYVGANPHGGNGKSDEVGGGHAHSGLICYQGGAWPKEYDGKLFMGNLHGHRLNVDAITPKGSGYVADRNPDFLKTNDKWSIPLALKTGPDGNVYMLDWYDKQICHRNEPEIWDRTNGRIYKISYKDTKPVAGFDLQKCTDDELVKYQANSNEWFVRHARRILQERATGVGTTLALAIRQSLEAMATDELNESARLRGLWALTATGAVDEPLLQRLIQKLSADPSPQVQSWMLRLVLDYAETLNFPISNVVIAFAKSGASPIVRRTITTAFQRLPVSALALSDRVRILAGLFNHVEDVNDHNLPYLYWYALETLVGQDPKVGLELAANAKIPLLLQFAARRAGANGSTESIAILVNALGTAANADHQLAYLRGIQEGLKGKRTADAPKRWAEVFAKLIASESADVRNTSFALAVTFGDASAFDVLRKSLADRKADVGARQSALSALLDARDKQLPAVLHQLLGEAGMRAAAVRALAAFDDAKTSSAILAIYSNLTATEKRDAVGTLSSRPAYGMALLDAIGTKAIPATDVPAELIRQLRNLNDAKIDAKIAAVWGTVRDTPADRKKLIADWTKKLNAPQQVDLGAGRAVFNKVCQQCHTLYGVGAKTGPEITGANRSDLGYLLENIFDPSAVIPKEYAATKLDLTDGRVLTGIIKEETKTTLTVITATETLTVAVADVDKRTPSPLSMMPDDLTKQLSEPDLRNLVAYLRYPSQVPMLLTKENSKDFFNGKDLTNWEGDKEVWSVENGELVGKTAKGLKSNNFLMSTFDATDFKLKLKVKLTPNGANSGVQFRSVPIEGGEMRGPQADIGAGWWGKLYEESGRGLLAKEGGEQFVKPGEWNDYEVEAIGGKVRIAINGKDCTNYGPDDKLARRGRIALQVHSGGPTDVRFKDIVVEVLK